MLGKPLQYSIYEHVDIVQTGNSRAIRSVHWSYESARETWRVEKRGPADYRGNL